MGWTLEVGKHCDAENKQIEVIDNSVTTGAYSYDSDGKRIKKHVPATGEVTVFIYAGAKLVAEYSTEISQDPKVSYTTADHLGSPRILTDENGATISRRDFHPFGEETYTPQRTQGLGYVPDDIRQKFTTYERDDESGLDFAQARYFNSGFGRFSSPDDFLNDTRASDPASWNLYIYVRNNPLRFIDPTGKIQRNADGTVRTEERKDVDRTVVRINGKEYQVFGQAKNGKYIVWETKKVTAFADDGTPIKAYKTVGDIQLAAFTSNASVDSDGNLSIQGNLDSSSASRSALETMYPDQPSPFSAVADCHGVAFASGELWINNDQVEALMKGDGYDIDNPSTTPFNGAVGIYSNDGTLNPSSVTHSVYVIDPGSEGGTIHKNGDQWTAEPRPTTVGSKGGITAYIETTPQKAWTTPTVLRYYGKKAGN